MRQHIQLGIFLNDCHASGQVCGTAQIDAAHAIAVFKAGGVDMCSTGALHNIGGQPGKTRVLLYIAVFC